MLGELAVSVCNLRGPPVCGISLMRVAGEIEEHMTLWFSSLPVKLCSTETATCETVKNPGHCFRRAKKWMASPPPHEDSSPLNEMA